MLRDLVCKSAKGRDKPYKLADSHGLYLYVTPKGCRSWRWNYRFQGKSGTRTLGTYPETSLSDARLARAELDKLRRNGTDPSIGTKLALAALRDAEVRTFEAAAREWHARRRATLTPQHAENILSGLEKEVFPHFGNLNVKDIKSSMVLAALKPIIDRGAIDRAHRTRQFIASIFDFAISSDWAESNPASRLKGALPAKRNGRQPALRSVEDARALLQTVEAEPAYPLTKLVSRMLAITAVRSFPLRMAEPHEFEDLDGEQPIWRIPAAKMKLDVEQKRQEALDFIVPLPPQAVEIVKFAMAFSPGAKYVFPSSRHYHKPMSENAISSMYRRLPRFASRHVPHGWRSTFSTVMNERAQEMDRPNDRAVIDLMLAHKPTGVEAAYNRSHYMARRRQIAEEWANLLLDGLPPAASLLEGRRR